MMLLILIYSSLIIDVEIKENMATCLIESKTRIGEKLQVKYWDDMNGSNPIPKVHTAFCAYGYTK